MATTNTRHDTQDAILTTLVDIVNAMPDPFSFGVTLYVKGVVITGELISNQHWTEKAAEQMDAGKMINGDGTEEPNPLGEIFRKFGEKYEENREKLQSAKEVADQLDDRFVRAIQEVNPTTYIHLKDAAVVQEESLSPRNGMLWRGRLAEVDGWHLGNISVSD